MTRWWLSISLALALLAPFAGAQEAEPQGFDRHLTPQALTALRDEVLPLVEQATGVTLDPRPPVRAITGEALATMLREEIAPQMKVALPDATAAQREAQLEALVRQWSQAALGKYAVAEGALVFAGENFANLSKALRQPRMLTRDWLRVVMIHELVHATQQQRWKTLTSFAEQESAERLAVLNAVVEGHAQWVTRQILVAEDQQALFDAFEASVIALPPDLDAGQKAIFAVVVAQFEFAYVDGRKFFDALAGKLPREGLAQRLFVDQPPTSRRQIMQPELYLEPGKPLVKADLSKVWPAVKRSKPDWAAVEREFDLPTLRAGMAPLEQPERAATALKGVVQARALILHPGDGRRMVVAAVFEHRDADRAIAFAKFNEDLSRHKDKTMKQGSIQITKATYTPLESASVVGTFVVKDMASGGQQQTVGTVLARSGRFTIELFWQGEQVEQAAATELVEAMAAGLAK